MHASYFDAMLLDCSKFCLPSSIRFKNYKSMNTIFVSIVIGLFNILNWNYCSPVYYCIFKILKLFYY